MNATIFVPLLVCIIGALVYALAANGKLARLGEIAYGNGLLVTLLEVAQHMVRF